jgi:hypothetical protein
MGEGVTGTYVNLPHINTHKNMNFVFFINVLICGSHNLVQHIYYLNKMQVIWHFEQD